MERISYPKIQTVYLRDPENSYKTLLEGQFARPELEYLSGNKWYYTEKVDGSNCRCFWDGEGVSFGGRTDNAQMPMFLIERLQTLFPKELFMETEMPPCILFGEGYGARIQKGGGNYISDGVDFILFDVLIDGWWLERDNVEDVAQKLELKVVPIVGEGTLLDAVEMVKKGFKSQVAQADIMAEGLVMKPQVTLMSRSGQRVITKIKHKDFI